MSSSAKFVAAVEAFESRSPETVGCDYAALDSAVLNAGGIPEGGIYLNRGRNCASCLGNVGITGGSISMRNGACGWGAGAEMPPISLADS